MSESVSGQAVTRAATEINSSAKATNQTLINHATKPVEQRRVESSDGRNIGASQKASEAPDAELISRLSSVKLAITIDEAADLPVIKIFDADSGDEILQVPAEHSLQISKTIKAAVGKIFDQTV